MSYNREKHDRRSVRLPGYDYANPGAYFVTICTHGRACLFGEIDNGEIRLNDSGRMIVKWWTELGNKYPLVELDNFVIMPPHFHGIVLIVGADLRVRLGLPEPGLPTTETTGSISEGAHVGAPLPQMMQWFKTMTTNEYIRGVKRLEWQPFTGKLWQRGYHEHVIRNENALGRIREYIQNNPAKWSEDPENPANAG